MKRGSVVALGLSVGVLVQQPPVPPQPPVIPPVWTAVRPIEPPAAENAHHFIVVQVDGDRLSLEVISTAATPYTPYNGSAKIVLSDRVS